MEESDRASLGDVFINCPFDSAYVGTFRALIFTVYACGFVPRSAREADDAGEPRIEKLYRHLMIAADRAVDFSHFRSFVSERSLEGCLEIGSVRCLKNTSDLETALCLSTQIPDIFGSIVDVWYVPIELS